MKKMLLLVLLASSICMSAQQSLGTRFDSQYSIYGKVGLSYMDCNLWTPVMGGQVGLEFTLEPLTNFYNGYRHLPVGFFFSADATLMSLGGVEKTSKYDRSFMGVYLQGGLSLGYSVSITKKSALQGFLGMSAVHPLSIKGKGVYVDNDVEGDIGFKGGVTYMLKKFSLGIEMMHIKHDLDPFGEINPYSLHERTFFWALVGKYRLW